MRITRVIAMLRDQGFIVTCARVRVNGYVAYCVQFPGEDWPRHAYYTKDDLLALVMR